jgi:hypothetical protein
MSQCPAARLRAGSLVAMSLRLHTGPIRCTGHGLCSDLLPERSQLDRWP